MYWDGGSVGVFVGLLVGVEGTSSWSPLGTVGNIAHKSLVFSTVGDPRVFERLPQGLVKPALAVSLHAPNNLLRDNLVPLNRKYPLDELLSASPEVEQVAKQLNYV